MVEVESHAKFKIVRNILLYIYLSFFRQNIHRVMTNKEDNDNRVQIDEEIMHIYYVNK